MMRQRLLRRYVSPSAAENPGVRVKSAAGSAAAAAAFAASASMAVAWVTTNVDDRSKCVKVGSVLPLRPFAACEAPRPASSGGSSTATSPPPVVAAVDPRKYRFSSLAFQPQQSMPLGKFADASCVRGFRIAASVDGRKNITSFVEVGVCVAQNGRAYQEDSWAVLAKDIEVMAKEARARPSSSTGGGGWRSWFRRGKKKEEADASADGPEGGDGDGEAPASPPPLPRPMSGTDVSAVLAVFDGHGGDACSKHATKHLHGAFENELAHHATTRKNKAGGRGSHYSQDDDIAVLEETLLDLDRSFASTVRLAGGSTAVAVAIDFIRGHLVCSNVGDSRAVLIRPRGAADVVGNAVLPLSSDHSPGTRPDEVERIVRLGGEVKADMWEKAIVLAAGGNPDSCQRVFQPTGVGGLNMTRALGDVYLKPLVIPTPESTVTSIQDPGREGCSQPSFLVLATDGVWDVLPNGLVAKTVAEIYSSTPSADEGSDSASKAQVMALKLVQMSQKAGSKDNITCMVVQLPAP